MSQMSSEPNDTASKSAPLQPNTVQIPLHLIEVGNRLRKLKAAKVIHIADSMAAQGQLQPIIVAPRNDGHYTLLAGNYRKAAGEKLGWETIRAELREGLSDDEASLIEIDENLKRNDLSAAERAKHTHERKKIFEHIHPETKPTKKGGPGRGNRLVAKLATSLLGRTKAQNASPRIPLPRPIRANALSSVMHGVARPSALRKSRELVSILARKSMQFGNFSNSIRPRPMN